MLPYRRNWGTMSPDFLAGNRLSLLNSGRAYFPALLRAIREAEREIFLESYIYANDAIGQEVAHALARAAARGVAVRVLVDGFGARNFEKDFVPRLQEAGVECLVYRREIAPFKMRRHRLRRLHRKIAVIDGRVAFVGGINIVDDYNAPSRMAPRYDYAVQVEGPVLSQIHRAVRLMWERVAWASFRRRRSLPPAEAWPCCEVSGQQSARFLQRDNLRHRNDIAHAYLDAIDQAQEEIILANAYFLPGLRFRHALRAAARRGVRVSILLQGEGVSDHPLLLYATQALYSSLLSEGMRVFEYQRSFLHAKVGVIDGQWATVGSSNIDPFSLLLAQEGNLFVQDADFAAQLKSSLEEAIASGARESRLEDQINFSLFSRLIRWCCYGLVSLMLAVSGYAGKPGQEDSPGGSKQDKA